MTISAFIRMRALILFEATPRAWVRDAWARAIVWTAADQTRRGQLVGSGICESAGLVNMRLSGVLDGMYGAGLV